MNTDTGNIRYLEPNEKPLPNEIEVRKPDSKCPRCHGKGSYLADVTKDLNYGNRAQRRAAKKHGESFKYLPCPVCTEIKKEVL